MFAAPLYANLSRAQHALDDVAGHISQAFRRGTAERHGGHRLGRADHPRRHLRESGGTVQAERAGNPYWNRLSLRLETK